MRKITAKFASKCHASGLVIKKGEEVYYDSTCKKVYKIGYEPEINPDAAYVAAQEEAYFENWYQKNY